MTNDEVIKGLGKRLSSVRSVDRAFSQAKYMRSQFVFLGITAGDLKKQLVEFVKEYDDMPYERVLEIVQMMYGMEYREYHYGALFWLEKYKKSFRKEDVGYLKRLALTHSWWDTVDFIAPKLMGNYFSLYPEMLEPSYETWKEHPSFWLHRCLVIFQLGYKQKTDRAWLERIIKTFSSSSEFFIRKAIGWALREYSKTNPDYVRGFVEREEAILSNLSKREAMKVIRRVEQRLTLT